MPATATGLLAHNGNGAVGWLIPQPWVVDEKGDTVRLDDVVGGRWTVLHPGPHRTAGLANRRRPHRERHAGRHVRRAPTASSTPTAR